MNRYLLTLITTLLISISSYASTGTLIHKILPGSLHKDGRLEISSEYLNTSSFKAIFKYNVVTRLLVPAPKKLKNGVHSVVLPIEFHTREGYELLATEKELSNKQATLKFLGFVDYKGLVNVYKIQISPISGKWGAVLYYHPNIAGLGWVSAELTINKLPLIGKYTLKSELNSLF